MTDIEKLLVAWRDARAAYTEGCTNRISVAEDRRLWAAFTDAEAALFARSKEIR